MTTTPKINIAAEQAKVREILGDRKTLAPLELEEFLKYLRKQANVIAGDIDFLRAEQATTLWGWVEIDKTAGKKIARDYDNFIVRLDLYDQYIAEPIAAGRGEDIAAGEPVFQPLLRGWWGDAAKNNGNPLCYPEYPCFERTPDYNTIPLIVNQIITLADAEDVNAAAFRKEVADGFANLTADLTGVLKGVAEATTEVVVDAASAAIKPVTNSIGAQAFLVGGAILAGIYFLNRRK